MIKKFLCNFTGHVIVRHRVWHDNLDFRTRCRRCKSELYRSDKGWASFDESSHSDEGRNAHPRYTS